MSISRKGASSSTMAPGLAAVLRLTTWYARCGSISATDHRSSAFVVDDEHADR